jgi:hypothetical protein
MLSLIELQYFPRASGSPRSPSTSKFQGAHVHVHPSQSQVQITRNAALHLQLFNYGSLQLIVPSGSQYFVFSLHAAYLPPKTSLEQPPTQAEGRQGAAGALKMLPWWNLKL